MHIQCPHCHNAIELADAPDVGEITCAGCGSSFQFDKYATATWQKPENKRLGKFELIDSVGQGAFGTVYKARDTELDRIVAIKIPRAGNVGTDKADIDRFLREARAVAQLRFPSIISIHEVGLDNGMPYLVSDFVEGLTLADLLTGRRLTFQESAKLIAEIADALQYAHSLGVIHRDVKPSNIMVVTQRAAHEVSGGDLKPVLMDFGLAKRDAGEITMTIDGQILGTPAYMSPEQARGEGHQVDGRSDVYSLGVILYQLLTAELPFRGNKAMLLHEEPQRPRALNDKIPRDLETIALKAMAKEPGRRYGSAKEMAEDLRRWLAGEPILARPVGAAERLWRWCKRKPALATANAAVITALIAVSSLLCLVKLSLDQVNDERGKAVKLAGEKQTLADEKQRLADESDERRDRAEHLAVQVQFDRAYQRYINDPAAAMAACAPLLAMASRLKDRTPEHTLRTFLTAWQQQIDPGNDPSRHAVLGGITSAAFSPDSKKFVTVNADKTAQWWDSVTVKPLGRPIQHAGLFAKGLGTIYAAAFSPDSESVVTASDEGTVEVGGAIGLHLQHQGRGINEPARVLAAAFSPDGKSVVTGSEDGIAHLWDSATGKQLGPPLEHEGSVYGAAVSADGTRVLTTSHLRRRGVAWLWDRATGKPLGPLLQHQQMNFAAAFSPDGKRFFTAAETGMLQLWDSVTGKPCGAPLNHQGEVLAAAFSHDSKIVVTASRDKTARLWDSITGKPLGAPLEHKDEVWAAALSPDGRIVVTGCRDKTARLWNVADGKPLGKPVQHGDAVVYAAFRPDGKSVLTLSADNAMHLWNVPRPVRGTPEQIVLWSECRTGLTPDQSGELRRLTDAERNERDQRLGKLGGPPTAE